MCFLARAFLFNYYIFLLLLIFICCLRNFCCYFCWYFYRYFCWYLSVFFDRVSNRISNRSSNRISNRISNNLVRCFVRYFYGYFDGQFDRLFSLYGLSTISRNVRQCPCTRIPFYGPYPYHDIRETRVIPCKSSFLSPARGSERGHCSLTYGL